MKHAACSVICACKMKIYCSEECKYNDSHTQSCGNYYQEQKNEIADNFVRNDSFNGNNNEPNKISRQNSLMLNRNNSFNGNGNGNNADQIINSENPFARSLLEEPGGKIDVDKIIRERYLEDFGNLGNLENGNNRNFENFGNGYNKNLDNGNYNQINFKNNNFNNSGVMGKFGLVGLENLGNTCYMNSALQCLSHVSSLTKYFLENSFEMEKMKRNGYNSKEISIIQNYSLLIRKLHRENFSIFKPQSFKALIGNINSNVKRFKFLNFF